METLKGKYHWFKADESLFSFFEKEIAGDKVVLVIPKGEKAVGVPWYENEKIYRSSVWRVSDGFPVSLGYKKFVNFGEQPDFEPVNINDKITAIEKVDGTCLICSKYKGEYIFRTRGCYEASSMHNGNEVPMLVERYNIKRILDENEGCSIIFEWTTPTNILCVKYDEPDLFLTGIVEHSTYSYKRQEYLDEFAARYGLKRPRNHTVENCNADELAASIRDWINAEGVVAYFGEEQQILKKMKSNWHFHLHVARGLIGNTKKLIKFLFENNAFDGDREFYNKRIESMLEYETLVYYEEKLDEVWNAWKEYNANLALAKELVKDVHGVDEIVEGIRERRFPLSDTYIWAAYKKKEHRKSFVFDELIRLCD